MPLQREMAVTLVKVLSIVYIVLGALAVATGMMFLTGVSLFTYPGFENMSEFLRTIAVGIIVVGVLEAVTGALMFLRKPWTRILGAVVGILGLLSFPVGTAIGVFAIWLLLVDPTSKALFEQPSPVPAPV